MACAILTILFVNNEVSFDRFHQNTLQLYRLTTTVTNADNSKQTLGTTGQVQGPAFKVAVAFLYSAKQLSSIFNNLIIWPEDKSPL